MAIKVHGIATFNCQRVILALLEFRIEDFEVTKWDMMNGAHMSPEFLSTQPFHQAPVFHSGDFLLYESRAIVRYIAENFKEQGPAGLLVSTPEERALVDQWVEKCVALMNWQKKARLP